MSGGVFSNVKVNALLRKLTGRLFVFPHMGDGGLALGAALSFAHSLPGASGLTSLDSRQLGSRLSREEIESALREHGGFQVKEPGDACQVFAEPEVGAFVFDSFLVTKQ